MNYKLNIILIIYYILTKIFKRIFGSYIKFMFNNKIPNIFRSFFLRITILLSIVLILTAFWFTFTSLIRQKLELTTRSKLSNQIDVFLNHEKQYIKICNAITKKHHQKITSNYQLYWSKNYHEISNKSAKKKDIKNTFLLNTSTIDCDNWNLLANYSYAKSELKQNHRNNEKYLKNFDTKYLPTNKFILAESIAVNNKSSSNLVLYDTNHRTGQKNFKFLYIIIPGVFFTLCLSIFFKQSLRVIIFREILNGIKYIFNILLTKKINHKSTLKEEKVKQLKQRNTKK